jgi:predicted amidohydrolase
VKVAAIQFRPEFVVPIYEEMGDKDVFLARRDNLQKLAKLVEEAAAGGASVIVLPELCTTGYGFMNAEEAAPHAEMIGSGPTMQIMKALAAKLKVHIVWGFVRKDDGTSDLYNSQACVDPSGYYVFYDKVNLWGNDYLWAKPGRGNPPVMTSQFPNSDDPSIMETKKLGLLICRDVRDKKNDEWSSFYGKGDADVVCLSANWGDGGFPATSWMEFVQDNNCWLIVSNRYGQEGPNNFGEGGVCIISPKGVVQCGGLKWEKDCIVYGEID